MRRRAKFAKAKVEAKPTRKNDGARVRDLEQRLAEARQREADALKRESEALERQTATAEVVRIISGAPTDLQPVFDAILDSVMRLFRPWSANVCQFDGELIHLAATRGGPSEAGRSIRDRFPTRPTAGLTVGRCVLDRAVIEIHDVETDAGLVAATREMARARGWRSALAVPMLRDGEPVGVIMVTRIESGRFESGSVELLQTFADQAVIALENVRLFNQTKEALERQIATSEILRVISSSPTDIQPVFDIIAANAARLCAARDAQVLRVEGDVLRLVSAYGSPSMPSVRTISRGHAVGRAVIDRQTIHVRDMAQAIAEFPETSAPQHGVESVLAVPLLREDVAVGVIRISRTQRQPFTEQQIALLQTFANQAVIAVENARLFNETKEALEQQRASSEILGVISSSPTDVQPVFDVIVRSAVRLCGGLHSNVYRVEDGLIQLVAHHNFSPVALEHLQRRFPVPVSQGEGLAARVIREGILVHLRDAQSDPEVPETTRHVTRALGARSVLYVPMLRDRVGIGVIVVSRGEVRPFSDKEIALIKTFADQAVIAIENVRLFKELEARTAALTRSVDQLTALDEVGRAVSSTLDLATVLTTIVSRAVELSGLDGGVVLEYNEGEQEFVQRAQAETGGPLAAARRGTRIRRGEGVVGRTAMTLEPIQVADITAPGAYVGPNRENLIESGVRAILAVPMVREGQLIGCLGVTRNQPGEFPRETIELLRTFAAQSALAIQNARLFQEIEEKSRQLEAASQHKSEFLANMSHELRTPLNAIIGFSEVLTERMFGDLNEKQEEYLKDIYASGTHLLSLINDILDLSKIEAGRMELELTDFDLPQAIDNALTLVRERAGRRGITLEHSVDERLGEIRGDERKVKQVLLNLLSNALKFTPEGGRVEVRAGLVDGMAEISVTDTGVGIAPEDQGAIFEEFRQVGTADKKAEGTGLGLTLCRKFVELHGGRIWVKSQVGVGSTFTFTIPVRRGE